MAKTAAEMVAAAKRQIENLTVEMTYTSKELIDYLIKSVGSEFGRSIFTKEFQAQKAVTGSGHIHG